MVSGLDGFSWFGLVVYFFVMALVIRGVRIPVPAAIGDPLIRLLVTVRLRDPPDDTVARGRPPSPPQEPVDPQAAPSQGSPRPSLRARSESKIGVEDEAAVVNPPLHVPVDESPRERLIIALDLRTAPVAGVVLLLITTAIDGSVLRLGIVGEDGVRPYDVLVLFISLAYISTALDSTGALRSLAFYISQKAARTSPHSSAVDKTASGPRLFSWLFGFWFIAGVIVGNDPIVLSGTAFLGYFTRVTGITNPTAWTFSQFIAANVASAVLVSSNPTNVLIAAVKTILESARDNGADALSTQAFKLNFLTGYTKFTIVPSFIAAAVAYPLTYLTFTILRPPAKDASLAHASHAYIPAHLLPPDVAPRSALLDPRGAIFHTTLLALTLCLLVGTSFVPDDKVQVWMVTAAAGIIAVGRDVLTEWWTGPAPAVVRAEEEIEMDAIGGSPAPKATKPLNTSRVSLPSILRAINTRFPTTSSTISRLPLSLLPFAGGIFVLARALTSLGWTSIFATWLARICINPAAAVFFIGYFGALVLCPLCGTNIGATILLVEIIRDDNFTNAPHVVANPRILTGAIFSTALASNLGAFSWTFSSSLAGLLWVSILRQKGINVKGREFAKWNALFLPLLSTAASAFVLLECYYF
ncbi:hypothetical protein MNV49_000133 [Pseudohyphozyma bogoriensis]|nr:hypothetical protein MNV49_000133 [Pseudohyphozyma bogoriensis]